MAPKNKEHATPESHTVSSSNVVCDVIHIIVLDQSTTTHQLAAQTINPSAHAN